MRFTEYASPENQVPWRACRRATTNGTAARRVLPSLNDESAGMTSLYGKAAVGAIRLASAAFG